MGRQSARMYFRTKDHKDIYFRKHYHSAMFLGTKCLWYKIDEDFFSFKVSDTMIDQNEKIFDSPVYPRGTVVLNIRGLLDESYSPSTLRVYWGDDTFEEVTTYSDLKHTYPTSNGTEYEVKIYGKIGTFQGYFYYAGNFLSCITEILTPLQYGMTSVNNANESSPKLLSGMFSNTKSLRKVCDYLFSAYKDYNENVNALNVFQESGIEEIPSAIFSGISNIDIGGAFINCKNLKNINPTALFGATYSRATRLFYGCDSITMIPSTLFSSGFEDVTDFSECFYECISLTDVPDLLFYSNDNATNFEKCFYKCVSITSRVPALWERKNAVGNQCYYLCSNAINYNEIPMNWR